MAMVSSSGNELALQHVATICIPPGINPLLCEIENENKITITKNTFVKAQYKQGHTKISVPEYIWFVEEKHSDSVAQPRVIIGSRLELWNASYTWIRINKKNI